MGKTADVEKGVQCGRILIPPSVILPSLADDLVQLFLERVRVFAKEQNHTYLFGTQPFGLYYLSSDSSRDGNNRPMAGITRICANYPFRKDIFCEYIVS